MAVVLGSPCPGGAPKAARLCSPVSADTNNHSVFTPQLPAKGAEGGLFGVFFGH